MILATHLFLHLTQFFVLFLINRQYIQLKQVLSSNYQNLVHLPHIFNQLQLQEVYCTVSKPSILEIIHPHHLLITTIIHGIGKRFHSFFYVIKSWHVLRRCDIIFVFILRHSHLTGSHTITHRYMIGISGCVFVCSTKS